MGVIRLLVALALGLLVPVAAPGQVPNPGNPADFVNNPHPTMPWEGGAWKGGYGAVVRSWVVPERQVAVNVAIPQPGSLPAVRQDVMVTLPAYVVTETSRGWVYGGRWTLVQVADGDWRLQWVGDTFVPRP